MEQAAVRLSNITKRFGRFAANDDVSLEVRKGEIHAIVGENGAGKSTLMNVVYGLVKPDEGSLSINGVQRSIRRPSDAINLGIGMVHQHMMQVGSYSVLDNIILGREPRAKWGLTDRKRARAAVNRLSSGFELNVDMDQRVCDLPVGLRQRVEIVKLLYRGADTIVLDEPTAVLSPQGTEELLAVMRNLRSQGKTILFISHKLPEVLSVADRISVMRKGKLVATVESKATTEEQLVELMIGRSPAKTSGRARPTTGQVVLEVERLYVHEPGSASGLRNACLQVRAGEIVAIAGVEGNGQRELASALIGIANPDRGRIVLNGQEITHLPVRARRELGMAFVPEDRVDLGLVLNATVTENAVLGPAYRRSPVSSGWMMNWSAADSAARQIVERYQVKMSGPARTSAMGSLSGGNMQKLLVGRELAGDVKCLVICQPTRGLDIGAKAGIYDAVFAMRDAGCAVLTVSTDLDEIFEIADRIMVMYKGGLVADLPRSSSSPEEVGLYMTGVRSDGVGTGF